MKINYTIARGIFTKFPGYVRGLVVATGIDNTVPAHDVLRLLREAEAAWAGVTPLETLLSSPKISSWRDAFRTMGANPGEYRPAHEALVRRALQGKALPSINAAVNIGNALSLRHCSPVGVHPIDAIRNGMELRFASGDETFTAFGSDKLERPRMGEVVFADGNEILSRAWVWRQSRCSVTLPETRAFVMNIDGLPPSNESDVRGVCMEASAMIQQACGGASAVFVLSQANPSAALETQ